MLEQKHWRADGHKLLGTSRRHAGSSQGPLGWGSRGLLELSRCMGNGGSYVDGEGTDAGIAGHAEKYGEKPGVAGLVFWFAKQTSVRGIAKHEGEEDGDQLLGSLGLGCAWPENWLITHKRKGLQWALNWTQNEMGFEPK